MEELTENGKQIGLWLRALILAALVTTALLLALAFVLLKVQPDTGTTELLILLIYVLSCFAGGWYRGRRSEKRKFLQGMITGLLYFVLLFLISGLEAHTPGPDLPQSAAALVLCVLGGMLGGMLA